jgi:type I restriction enzyme R subunit
VNEEFSEKQQAFLNFVLSHYVTVGVEELSAEKLTPLLKLKYHDSIPDAVADLGAPKQIQEAFVGFQKFLYMFAS